MEKQSILDHITPSCIIVLLKLFLSCFINTVLLYVYDITVHLVLLIPNLDNPSFAELHEPAARQGEASAPVR